MRLAIQKRKGIYEFRFKLDRGLARRGPNLCAPDPDDPRTPKTQMTLSFTIVSLDASRPDVRVTTTKPWECPQPGRFHMRARPKPARRGDSSSGDTPGNKAPRVNYTVAPRRGPVPLTAQFTDTTNDPDGTIVSRLWDFGDGSTSSEANPSHTYLVPGDYDIVFTVVDDKGATSTKAESEKIRVDPAE
jgi:PKD repeat protein